MMDAATKGIEPKSQFIQAMNDRMGNVHDLEEPSRTQYGNYGMYNVALICE